MVCKHLSDRSVAYLLKRFTRLLVVFAPTTGTWNLPCGNYSVVFGIKDKPFDRSDRRIVALDTFNASESDSQIVWDASVRMSRRVRHSGDDFYGIMESLRQQGPVHGQPLSQVIIEQAQVFIKANYIHSCTKLIT